MDHEAHMLMIVDKHGVGISVGDRAFAALHEMGLLTPCTHKRFVWHANAMTLDAIEALLEELGVLECGFCREGQATHGVKIDQSKIEAEPGTIVGESRPLMLCDECSLLFMTGDRDLLLERCLDSTITLNRRLNPHMLAQGGGEEKARELLRPTVERVTDETLGATVGKPYELPPRVEQSGIVIIGGE